MPLARRVPKAGGGVTSVPKAARTGFLETRLRLATAPQLLSLIRQLEDLAVNLAATPPDAFHASLRLVVRQLPIASTPPLPHPQRSGYSRHVTCLSPLLR